MALEIFDLTAGTKVFVIENGSFDVKEYSVSPTRPMSLEGHKTIKLIAKEKHGGSISLYATVKFDFYWTTDFQEAGEKLWVLLHDKVQETNEIYFEENREWFMELPEED